MSFFPPKTLELTLALFKPTLVKLPHAVQAVREDILQNGFYVVRSKRFLLTPDQVKRFYKEHEGKPFHARLVSFMLSGPIDAYILAREDAVKKWRNLMGPTMAVKAQYVEPESIRAQFGLSDTRNATHGSDSNESFKKEAFIVFPNFNTGNWYDMEEVHFRNGYVKFVEESYVHCTSESSPFTRPC